MCTRNVNDTRDVWYRNEHNCANYLMRTYKMKLRMNAVFLILLSTSSNNRYHIDISSPVHQTSSPVGKTFIPLGWFVQIPRRNSRNFIIYCPHTYSENEILTDGSREEGDTRLGSVDDNHAARRVSVALREIKYMHAMNSQFIRQY